MKLIEKNRRSFQTLTIIATLFGVATTALAQNGTWSNPSNGSWADTANWSGGIIATNAGNTADFSTLTLGSSPMVTLDGARTIGNLIFGDAGNTYGWSLNTGSGGPLTLAVSSGAPLITVNNQTATVGVALAGTQGLTKIGSGVLTLTGANIYSGTTTVGTSADAGILTYSGSGSYAPATASVLNIGGATGKGVFNMNSSGTVSFTSGFPSIGGNGGAADTGVGALNQTAGTLNLVANGQYMTIGNNGSGATYGSVNLSGGTLTITSGAGIRLGYEGMGSYVQSGGTLNCGRYFVIGGGSTSGNGVTTFTGGSATVNSSYRIHLSDNAACKGTLNIGTEAGGNASVTALSTAGLYIVAVAGGNTALNLDSGTLTLGGPIKEQAAGNTALNLNGGTLRAGTATVTLIDTANSLVGNVYNGGIAIDSQANNATLTAPLLATTSNGVYPGGGTFAISSGGGSGYIGAPLVTVTTSGSGTGALAVANVSGGVVTGVTMTCPGQNYAASDTLTFTFSGGGFTSAATTFVYPLTANDVSVNSIGGLTKNGSGTLNLMVANTYTGNTMVNAGTLNVMADGGLGAGNVVVTDGAQLTLGGGATNDYLASTVNLALGASALANLNFTGNNTVNGLSLDGGATYVAVGTYGSSSSPATTTDDTHFTGTGVINVTAQPTGATVTLASSLNPAEVTQSVTFTATASGSSGTPTGTVTFKDGAATLGIVSLDGSGVAVFTSSVLAMGTHTITASYNGNSTYAAATATPLTQVINPHNNIWSGAVNNIWDINTTMNWSHLGASAVYNNGEQAQFDDTASGSTDVSLGVTVTPYGVVVSNNSKNYSLSGAGAITGSAGLSKIGTGTLTISNANSYTGNTTIQGGTLNFNDASASSGNGTLNVSNGVVNVSSSGIFTFGGNASTSVGGIAGDDSDAGSGVINQTSGTVNLGVDSTYLELGSGNGIGTPTSYGGYNLSGGSLNFINTSGARVGASGYGVFRQTGGALNSARYFVVGTGTGGGNTGAGTGEATFTGGTATIGSSYRIILGDNTGSSGVLNLGTEAGGNATLASSYNSGGKCFQLAAAGSGTLNLNSGTLQLAGSIYQAASGNLNFNGGTLQATANMNVIDNSVSSILVFNGGAVIDTQGYNVTNATILPPASDNGIYPSGGSISVTSGGNGYIGAPLVTISGGSGYGAMAIANISGGAVTSVAITCPGQYYQAGDSINFDFTGGGAATPATTFNYTLQAGDVTANNGGLTKLGSGTLVLYAGSSYTGPTLVNGGTLVVNPNSSTGGGSYTLTNNSTLNVVVGYLGSQLNVSSLTFADLSVNTLTLDLTAIMDGNLSPTIAPVNDSGALNVSGVTTINLNTGGINIGQYPLIQYASRAGSGNFALGTLPLGVQAHLVTNTVATPNSIDLVVTSSGVPRWDGQVSGVPNGTWDINTTANWVDTLTYTVEPYKEGQPVLFDDNAGGTTTVNLTANVHPGSVTFNNNSYPYTLTGANKISGSTALTIQGYGNVTIQNALNDYTGGTTVGGGTLNITNLANGGSPSAIGAATADPANLVFTNGGNLNYSGPATTINRGYTVGAGGGTLTLNSDVTLSGSAVTVDSGSFSKAGVATLTYTGAGNNQLGATNNIAAGTVVLDGSAGNQSNSVSGLMLVGSAGPATGALVMTNTILTSGTLIVDYGTASLHAGSVLASSGTLNVGQSYGASASLTVTDNAVLTNPGVAFIGGVSGNGVLNLQSSGVTTLATTGQRFCLGGTGGSGDSGAGTINQSAGTFNFSPTLTDYLEIGAGDNNAYGAFNLSGGSAVEPSGFGIRVGASGLGVLNQSGGTLSCGRYLAIGTVGGSLATGGQGVATFTGGAASIDSGFRIIMGDKPGSSGVLNIGTLAGGNAVISVLNTSSDVQLLADNNAATGILNLNRGTLQLSGSIYKNTANTIGTSAVNLNGGTLAAGATGKTLINTSVDTVKVFNGGVTVDTAANTAIISANLLATTGNGVYPAGGTIAVSSSGSGYIGAPIVTATTATGSGSGVTAVANISGGVITSLTITCPGQGYAAGDQVNFDFNGGGSVNPASTFSYTLTAGNLAANGVGGLTKIGTGALTLSGTNTYAGTTVVSNGTLSVTGSLLGGGTVAVNDGATLGGSGFITSLVNVNSNATLAAGSTAIGSLTVSNTLTFAQGATNFVRLNASTVTNDSVVGLTQVNYAGTLVVTNLAGTLAAGDKFTLFSAGAYNGNFAVTNLPALNSGLAWSNSLAIDGSIQVVGTGVNTNPTNLTFSATGNMMTLSWPADYLGWHLQYQTNSLTTGLNTNWVTIPGSDTITSTNIPINPADPAVFYRMVYP